jgi:germination protein YpeB
MKKQIWAAALGLGVILAGAVAFWGQGQAESRRMMETALNNKYQRSFYDLTAHVQNVDVLLSKTLVGQETRQDTMLFMNLWQQADAAKRELAQIPVPDAMMARTIKYLSQVGDYANTLAKQTAEGKPKSDEQWRILSNLYSQSSGLNSELHEIERRIADGRLTLNELTTESRRALRKEGPKLANGDFQELDKNMQQFPTLIYDGPFSDHLEKKKSQGLTGANINNDQARATALKFIDRQGNVDYVANVASNHSSNIASYRVDINSRPVRANEKINVGIARQGGKVLWMVNSRTIGDKKITVGEAGKKAAAFLSQKGYNNMVSTYYEIQNNMAVFNFAAKDPGGGGIILYPDLVKVSVALDDGRVVGFEATNYWNSHKNRKIPVPGLTVAAARAKLSPRLENVTKGRLALIPLSADREQLTYEFKGNLGSDVFLIYINALNGKEERVLRLVQSSEGILTI